MDRSAAERLVRKDLDETTGLGKPLAERTRQTPADDRGLPQERCGQPRWMERIGDIDRGIANERRRLRRPNIALQLAEECGEDPCGVRGAVARDRRRVVDSARSTS